MADLSKIDFSNVSATEIDESLTGKVEVFLLEINNPDKIGITPEIAKKYDTATLFIQSEGVDPFGDVTKAADFLKNLPGVDSRIQFFEKCPEPIDAQDFPCVYAYGDLPKIIDALAENGFMAEIDRDLFLKALAPSDPALDGNEPEPQGGAGERLLDSMQGAARKANPTSEAG